MICVLERNRIADQVVRERNGNFIIFVIYKPFVYTPVYSVVRYTTNWQIASYLNLISYSKTQASHGYIIYKMTRLLSYLIRPNSIVYLLYANLPCPYVSTVRAQVSHAR